MVLGRSRSSPTEELIGACSVEYMVSKISEIETKGELEMMSEIGVVVGRIMRNCLRGILVAGMVLRSLRDTPAVHAVFPSIILEGGSLKS